MRTLTQIHLFGSFRKTAGDFYDHPIKLDLNASTSITEVLRELRICPDAVQLAMLNNSAVSKDSAINPGDRLSLFPKEYPIFADWKDFRLVEQVLKGVAPS